MRMIPLIATLALLTSCAPPPVPEIAVDPSSFEGYWYGIRPQGVTTFHSDSYFAANGEVEVRFYTCLSSKTESRWTDKGTWSYEDNLLTITLVADVDEEGDGETYTHQYTLLDESFDRRSFRSETGQYNFWLHRRWGKLPYDCTTTKADTEADRNAAIADGRFNSVYPDYTGTDS